MQPSPVSPAPEPRDPVEWEHFDLWRRVRRSLFAVPDHFVTSINLEGLSATDIFTLNTPLGATIEDSFVKTLNMLRPAWDPESRYQTYSFVRQAQTFPDVVLRTLGPSGCRPVGVVECAGGRSRPSAHGKEFVDLDPTTPPPPLQSAMRARA